VPDVVWIVLAVLVGAMAGPPLRAVIFAHSVESTVPWRTTCPACGAPVARRWVGLPPTGRCPACRSKVGPPPLAVELVAGAACAAVVWRAGIGPAGLALCWVALCAVALGFVDVAVHRLPDRLVAVALVGAFALFALAVATGTPAHRLLVATLCALGAGAGYFVLVFAVPTGMGLGDAKLAVLVGLVTGWYGVVAALYAIFVGFLLAGLTAVALLAARRVSRRDHIAHGPFMLLGALVVIMLLAR
jgi:leader peptidase (prepilin peptidase)/N-methyltransferase